MAEIEGNIPDVSNLVTKTALTTVKDKIFDVSNLVKKTDYDILLQKLELNLITIIIINILQLQSLIL